MIQHLHIFQVQIFSFFDHMVSILDWLLEISFITMQNILEMAGNEAE